MNIYHPQTKFGQGNVFTKFCHSVHGGGVSASRWSLHPGGLLHTGGLHLGGLGRPPPSHRILQDTLNEQAVLLERILDYCIFHTKSFCHPIYKPSYFSWGVLDCPNFGCFVPSRSQHFHCIAMGNSIKAGVSWHKIQDIEHTPANFLSDRILGMNIKSFWLILY